MTKDVLKQSNKARNPFCELWCNWCEKYIPAEDAEMAYSTDGHIIFSHKENHLLEVEIDISQALQKQEEEILGRLAKIKGVGMATVKKLYLQEKGIK